MSDRESAFFCYHPLAQRRRYADLRVCRECLSVASGEGVWLPARRRLRPSGDGRITLLAADGTVLTSDWSYVRARG